MRGIGPGTAVGSKVCVELLDLVRMAVGRRERLTLGVWWAALWLLCAGWARTVAAWKRARAIRSVARGVRRRRGCPGGVL